MFIFERGREGENKQGRERERERKTEDPKRALHGHTWGSNLQTVRS